MNNCSSQNSTKTAGSWASFLVTLFFFFAVFPPLLSESVVLNSIPQCNTFGVSFAVPSGQCPAFLNFRKIMLSFYPCALWGHNIVRKMTDASGWEVLKLPPELEIAQKKKQLVPSKSQEGSSKDVGPILYYLFLAASSVDQKTISLIHVMFWHVSFH